MSLPGFERFVFSHGDWERDVYRRGEGRGVVVIHEVPGITPEVRRFGDPHRESWDAALAFRIDP